MRNPSPTKKSRRRLAAVALLSILPAAFATSAQAAEGRIVQVQNGELIVDLGTADGLSPDAEVQVYRRLEVKHPVSGKKITDRFPIGTIRFDQVASSLAISTDFGSLKSPPKPGDFVVPVSEAPPEPDSESPDEAPLYAGTADPAQKNLEETFQMSLGMPIDSRIELWSRHLSEFPDSPYAATVASEVEWLRQQLAASRLPKTDLEREQRERDLARRATGVVAVPNRAPVAAPVEVVASFDAPQNVKTGRAFVRQSGERTFHEVKMQPSGDRTYSASLPDELVQNPGELEVVVEVVRTDGQLEQVGEQMQKIQIYSPPRDPAQPRHRSHANVRGEFVNFQLGERKDEYWRSEADFLYRLNSRFMSGFRVGAGIYSGSTDREETNATADDSGAAAGLDTQTLSLGYGFAETVFDIGTYFGWSVALQLGNRRGGTSQPLQSSVGLRTALRIGTWDGTRLEGGVAVTEGIGSEAWLTMELAEIEHVPMRAEVVVTNLPIGEDFGVSLNYGVGYDLTDAFSVLAHVGWNARTINDHGPGAGLSLTANW